MDTKLSSVVDLNQMIESLPSELNDYNNGIEKNIEKAEKESLFTAKFSIFELILNIVIIAAGILLFLKGDLITKTIPDVVFDLTDPVLKIFGLLFIAYGIFDVFKMFHSQAFLSKKKLSDNLSEIANEELRKNLESVTIDSIYNAIESKQELELNESSYLDKKITKPIANAIDNELKLSKIVFYIRIAVPVIFFALSLVLVFSGDKITTDGIALSFLFMFIFNKQLCKLLEYKVSVSIRAIMCVPSILYSFLVYINLSGKFAGQAIIQDSSSKLLTISLIVPIIMLIVLCLSVVFNDYYSEKKHLKEGIDVVFRGNPATRKAWYIKLNMVIYIILALFVFYEFCEVYGVYPDQNEIGDLGAGELMFLYILLGVLHGIAWRVINPLWPVIYNRVIRIYWGIRYSFVVELFLLSAIFVKILLTGHTYMKYDLISYLVLIITSIVAYIIMNIRRFRSKIS